VTDESWLARPAQYPAGPAQSAAAAARFQPDMRAADADRDLAIDVLRAGYAEGRLTKEEHEERVSLVYQSRTYGELAALTRDLPVGPVPGVPYPTGMAASRSTNGTAIAALICGLAEFPTLGLTAIPAIILGHSARLEIRQSGQDGDGMAIVGLILGWGAIALYSLVFISLMLLWAAHASAQPNGGLFPGFAG
jgi:Domain of unknown function (DUF1707)/Domain of unknown function (DUF4190)